MCRHRLGPVHENAYALAARQHFVGKTSPSCPFVRLRFATQEVGDTGGHISIVGGDTPGIQSLGQPIGYPPRVEASGSGG